MLRAKCPFEELHTQQQRVNNKAYLMYLTSESSQVVIRAP